jgi:ADP-heptose:LPS heptosyltransferase
MKRGSATLFDVFLQPLERLAIFDADRIPRLSVPDLSFDVLPSGNWLALHPGSGSERKNWPERNWAELLKHLTKSTDFGFLLVGGEAEGERLDRLAAVPAATANQGGATLAAGGLGTVAQTRGRICRA